MTSATDAARTAARTTCDDSSYSTITPDGAVKDGRRQPVRVPARAHRAEPRREPPDAAGRPTSAASGSAAPRKACRTSPSGSPPWSRGSRQWSPAEQLSDDSTRSEQNPILFAAPDGGSGCCTPRRRPATRTPPRSAAASPRTADGPGARWRPCSPPTRPAACSSGSRPWCCRPAAGSSRSSAASPRPGEKWVGNSDDSAVMISDDAGHHLERARPSRAASAACT